MTLKLSDKTEVPPMAFGTGTTFKYRGEVVTEVIEVAWDCGYRWFDTAMKYQTEEGLGDGLKRLMQNKGIKRKEFLVTTKVFGFLVTYDETIEAVEKSLKKLQMDYVDFLLIHTPGPFVRQEEDYIRTYLNDLEYDKLPRSAEDLKRARLEVWRALERFKDLGKAKHIGVSNFTVNHIEQIMNNPNVQYLPELNQMEIHPYMFDSDVIDYCKKNGILVQAYSVLGNGRDPRKALIIDGKSRIVLEDPTLVAIANEIGCSVAQVCLAWLHQQEIAVVIKSENEKRLKENLEALKYQLSNEHMRRISDINIQHRQFPDPYALK